jgi:DNA-3-methyladenine glycosylase I
LRKRPGFRAAFEGFDPEVVAQFSERDVQRLLLDSSIVRHRRKIEAAITNASALLSLWQVEGDGALTSRLEAAAKITNRSQPPLVLSEIPSSTQGSTQLARDLKGLGFTFLGPTTLYAALQATGFVNDHLAQCHCREPSRGASTRGDTE